MNPAFTEAQQARLLALLKREAEAAAHDAEPAVRIMGLVAPAMVAAIDTEAARGTDAEQLPPCLAIALAWVAVNVLPPQFDGDTPAAIAADFRAEFLAAFDRFSVIASASAERSATA